MTNDQKHALGVFLLVFGGIWFFFCLIWMPPLTLAMLWLLAKIAYEPDIGFGAFLYAEFALSLCAVGIGLYINIRRLIPEKIKIN
jgi:hypothetical protein